MEHHIVAAVERFKQQHQSGPSLLLDGRSFPGELPSTHVANPPTRSVTAPLSDLWERRVLAAYEGGPLLDAYRTLRTQVMYRLRENGWKLLGVTSPGKQEGKTLTAINLAISMAMDVTQTVLLVEADLRNPSLQQMFGLANGAGLADYLLLGNVPVQEVLVHSGIDRLTLLPVGRRIPNPCEALTSPRMLALLEELKTRYPSHVIILDLPAVLSDPDVLTLSYHIDATVLVVEEGRTTVQDLERAMELLKGATPIIGTVLNKADRLEAIRRA